MFYTKVSGGQKSLPSGYGETKGSGVETQREIEFDAASPFLGKIHVLWKACTRKRPLTNQYKEKQR